VTGFESAIESIRGADGFFSLDRPVYVSRAPGRLDLMGGNVDYTGGLVFQATIAEATWAAVQPRGDTRLEFLNPQMSAEGWNPRASFAIDEMTTEGSLREQVNRVPGLRWTAYVLGAFYWLRLHFPQNVILGANLYIRSEIPLNRGVSSSAAVEVAVMKAAAESYGIHLHGSELAEACQWVENVIAESACGVMDQAASVMGDEGYVLPLLCQPCQPQPLVKLPEGLCCWGIDSGVRHAVTGVEYEAARAATFIGYRLICEMEDLSIEGDRSGRIRRFVDPRWKGYLSNLEPSEFRERYESILPGSISGKEIIANGATHPDPFTTIRAHVNYRVRACTRYAVEENYRIRTFTALARSADSDTLTDSFQLMGELMFQSHWSYTECGLGCEATDILVNLVRNELGNGLFGAKITGGGGGGTVAVLGTREKRFSFERVVEQYAKSCGFTPYVFEGSSMGADRFGVHILEAER